MAQLLTAAVLLWFFGYYIRGEWRAYQASHRIAPTCRRPAIEEPAYRFPGIPPGWSLDKYAHDGISQINLHLAQTARRHRPSGPTV